MTEDRWTAVDRYISDLLIPAEMAEWLGSMGTYCTRRTYRSVLFEAPYVSHTSDKDWALVR